MKFNHQWDDNSGYPVKDRVKYLTKAAEVLEMLRVQSLLEIGPYGLRLSEESTVMDKAMAAGADIIYDAAKVPWPFRNNAFEAVAALQVWEHLEGCQQEAFNEAWRVATRCVMLSVPYLWESKREDHNGIGDETVLKWAGGRRWMLKFIVTDNRPRGIYVWLKRQ